MSEDQTQTEVKKNENRRYIAKVGTFQGSKGQFNKVVVENPNPTKEDGSANPYYKGSLLWFDATTNQYYVVKGMSIRGVSESARKNGYMQSLTIDLDNKFEAQPNS